MNTPRSWEAKALEVLLPQLVPDPVNPLLEILETLTWPQVILLLRRHRHRLGTFWLLKEDLSSALELERMGLLSVVDSPDRRHTIPPLSTKGVGVTLYLKSVLRDAMRSPDF